MGDTQARNFKIAALVLLICLLIYGAYQLSSIFNPLLIALLLAYMSDPFIQYLEKMLKHRLLAIISIYIYLAVLFILIPALVAGRLYSESSHLVVTLVGESSTDTNHNGRWDPGEYFTDLNGNGVADPGELFSDTNGNGKFDRFEDGYFYKLLERLKKYARKYDAKSYLKDAVDIDELIAWVKENLRQIASASTRVTGWLVNTVASSIQGAFEYLSLIILVPVYTFFFLYEWTDMKRTLTRYLPGMYRERILDIVCKIDRAVSSFFRGRLIICIIKSLAIALGLWLGGIRFSLFIGLLAGFLSLIPFLGVIMGAVPALTFVIIDHQGSPVLFAWVIVVFAAVEALEGVVLTPWILGAETGLHPITLIVSFMIFGKIFGLFGLLMAVPLMAIVKILGREFLLPIVEDLAEEDGGDACAAAGSAGGSDSEAGQRDGAGDRGETGDRGSTGDGGEAVDGCSAGERDGAVGGGNAGGDDGKAPEGGTGK